MCSNLLYASKAEFSAVITLVFSHSLTWHDPSKILILWFGV